MVTSYVPTNPMAPDCSILRGPRTNSDLEVLYCQWAEYRFQSLARKAAIISQVSIKIESLPTAPAMVALNTMHCNQRFICSTRIS